MSGDRDDETRRDDVADDNEHELLDALADGIHAIGGRLATPEETQVLVDRAVTSVMEAEKLIRATPLERTIDGMPEIPRGDLADVTDQLARQIQAMVADVHDPAVAYGPNRDGYGKCVEVMWRAGYLAHEVVASQLGVTGFQHSISSLALLGKLRGIEGPYLVIKMEDALFPQYDLRAKLEESLSDEDVRTWLAEKAAEKLAGDLTHVHLDVVAHWRGLVAAGEATSRAEQ